MHNVCKFWAQTCFEVPFHSFKSRCFFKWSRPTRIVSCNMSTIAPRPAAGLRSGGSLVSEGFESVKGPEIMHSIVESYTGPSCTVARWNIASSFFITFQLKFDSCFAGIMDTWTMKLRKFLEDAQCLQAVPSLRIHFCKPFRAVSWSKNIGTLVHVNAYVWCQNT